MPDEPGVSDLIAWLRTYPKLNGPTERVIWWAVFKRYWLWPLVVVLAAETFWHFLFKFLGW